ncbi:MFS transporter [Sphaerisporangium sp. TRM90804]|uniref:MFS transporter n=1 Tax=Sphaerisporangium sp. TRM90804 TaxID=3031113 RepID=UPI00244C838E|nr:MFS transporter [Sphaerisporangium sp. TRM90804]MDH2429703.1 MFS transporter [Sphaerisporangium sp. TRM90804]
MRVIGKTAKPQEVGGVAQRPASFRDVFGVAEYRALFGAAVLSWVGDYFAKVAVTFLVFRDTGSVLLSALGFAVSYLPWVAGGPLLAALAERYPYRRVMIACDLARMVLIGAMVLPGMPLPGLLLLLFGASLLTPPFQAARSALVARLLTGDRYVVGLSLQNMAAQAAQMAGYALGGALSAVDARGALLLNAAAFGASALILWRGVLPRPVTCAEVVRRSLLRETGDGLRLVFGHPVMRPMALVVFSVVAIVIVPEGLAMAWAPEFGGGSHIAGLLMAALPVGCVIGAVVTRVTVPEQRLRLVKPLLIVGPLLLVPALAGPPFPVVLLLVLLSAGAVNTVMVPLNGLFVQMLPDAFRARAFGIMQGGIQLTHAAAVLASGAIAERFPVPVVVGAWSLCGLFVMMIAVTAWPPQEVVRQEIARTAELNRATA